MLLHRDQTEEQLDALEGELLDEISLLMTRPLNKSTHLQLATALDELFQLLPIRFDLKESNGYLSHVLDEFPDRKSQVDRLWIEQALLYEDLREIREHLRDIDDYTAGHAWISVAIRDWLERLQRHEDEERRLNHDAALHIHE